MASLHDTPVMVRSARLTVVDRCNMLLPLHMTTVLLPLWALHSFLKS